MQPLELTKHVMNDERVLIFMRTVLLAILAFFVARVSLFQSLLVFSVGIVAVDYMDWKKTQFAGIGALLGLLSLLNMNQTFKYVSVIVLIMLSSLILSYYSKKQLTRLQQGAIIGILTGSMSIFFAFFNPRLFYGIMIGILEGVLSYIMVVLMSYSKDLLSASKKRRNYSQEEVIATICVVSLGIIGTYHLQFGMINLFGIVSVAFLIGIGYYYGPGGGTAFGVTLGLLLNLTTVSDHEMLMVLAVIGLFSGVMREMGKISSAIAGIVGGLILMFYTYEFEEVLFQVTPMILGVFVFLLIPMKSKKQLKKFHQQLNTSKNEYLERTQNLTSQRLKEFSDTFDELAVTFNTISDKKSELDQQDINKLIDEVVRQVCKDCDSQRNCWKTNFLFTYQIVRNIIDAADAKGSIAYSDIPASFYNKCYRYKDFIKTTNRLYEIYRINLNWYNKIIDSRQMVSNQLKGIAGVMDKLSADVTQNIQFYLDQEDKIMWQLEMESIYPEKVFLYRRFCDVVELELLMKEKDLLQDNLRIIKEVAEEITGTSLYLDKRYRMGKGRCRILYKQKQLYRVSTGIAAASKEKLSGDNFTSVQIAEDKHMIALADGMGTGYEAHKESTTTIELLERLLQSGFDHGIAVKMINSLMILKSEKDRFSTLDIALINLYSGECNLTKIGGSSVFVLGEEKVQIINSTSLPVGVLEGVEADDFELKLGHGDFLVMVTDGIMDHLAESYPQAAEGFVEIFHSIKSLNPKEIANEILAIITESGASVSDDMTVMVSRIWKER